MKTRTILSAFLICLGLVAWSSFSLAQRISEESIFGVWEVEGTILGDNGEGFVLPHKHSAPDCGKDHTQFTEEFTAKDVKYKEDCSPVENEFSWKLEENTLTLTKGERSVQWHILSIEDGQMKVGIQVRPDSENRMYVSYKKRE
ncbi:lipocalin family protein [Algoriphagus sp.]|uniref:lipocalin family protein n=1 Tax=Algoriphagus sp. TaxID=1872435 RepID=UPI002632559E|nr:lipocalin family protein [Algoriphagus sp.]